MMAYNISEVIFPPTLYSIASTFVLGPLLVLVCTFAFTNIRYLLHELNESDTPVPVPYTIPWLGQALSFLAPVPGKYWNQLMSRISRSKGACTLLLGGRKAHIIFNATAVQALFKNRLAGRRAFNVQVIQGFGMGDEDVEKMYGRYNGDPNSAEVMHHHMHERLLLSQTASNELTTKFLETLYARLSAQPESWQEVNLYHWLRPHMFKASAIGIMGARLMELFPNLDEDYWILDRDFLALFYGLPRFLVPTGYDARDRLIANLRTWVRMVNSEYLAQGREVDPNDGHWDPLFGSRLTRAKEREFSQLGVTETGRASLHLGFMFGLMSNAIPVSTWMLFHILNPDAESTLLPRTLAEIRSTRREDGTIDVDKLIVLPLLQSMFHETMRLYIDVLVTRQLPEDTLVPINASNNKFIKLGKDDIVMCPSWLGHRDETTWKDMNPDTWYAERFLIRDEKTGKDTFTLSGTNGKFFPFGGGKSMCPGRTFAKQEVLAAVATVLANFDFEVLGFVNEEGKKMEKFPGLRKSFVGNGAMAMDGDIRVRIRKRTS
jgi:cytochrome P450